MSKSDKNDILSGVIVRWSMFTAGCALILLGVGATVLVSVGSGTVIIVTGLAFILLAVFEVQSLELLGLSAKLKGRISEAEILLEKIRKVSVPLTQLAVSVAIRSGKWDSYIPSIKIYPHIKEIERELIEKGITSLDEFTEIKNEVIQVMVKELNELLILKIEGELEGEYKYLDVARTAVSDISNAQASQKLSELTSSMQVLSKEIHKVKALNQEDSEVINSKIKEYLTNSNSLPQDKNELFIKEVDEIQQDVKLLYQTGEVRRPDILNQVR